MILVSMGLAPVPAKVEKSPGAFMNRLNFFASIASFLLLVNVTAFAETGTTQRVDTLLVLANGAEVRGTFMEMKDANYLLRLSDGRVMSYPVVDVTEMKRIPAEPVDATQQAPANKTDAPQSFCRVFITEQSLSEEFFVPIKEVKMAKKWYGSVSDAYEALAAEAREVDADAVIAAKKWFAPSGFSWAAPKASGLAVKWTEQGRQAFPTLTGRCY